MLPMEAAEKVKGIKKPEEGYIRNYITSYEETRGSLMYLSLSVQY